ncbi:protein cereblon-like [Hetaerina americana]|uniref:protein cereblon-like n=1 Tax=Hetaerina americana TaxID=62018 RepID=UPI003A7F24CA
MWRRVKRNSTRLCWQLLFICFQVVLTARKEGGPEYLLCRYCGSDTADASYLSYLVSPEAISYKNQSVYGLQHVGVQLLENPHGNRFHLVTLKKAGCVGKGSWSSQDTWFPGYSWRNCFCTHCGRQLGWIFQTDPELSEGNNKSSNSFYALIVDKILSESFSDSLIAFPKI